VNTVERLVNESTKYMARALMLEGFALMTPFCINALNILVNHDQLPNFDLRLIVKLSPGIFGFMMVKSGYRELRSEELRQYAK
jgi:hypothetical protein